MTTQTKQVLKEAIEILNRIQGKEQTHKWFKEMTFKGINKENKEVKNGTGTKV